MKPAIKKNGINFGLILGLLLALPTLLGFAVNISLLVSYWTILYIFLAVIIAGLFVIGSVKKSFGGFISFKDAFTSFFVMLLISAIISSFINILIFNVVAPDFKEVVKEKKIEMAEKQRDWIMSKMANAPQEQVDETNDKIDKSIAEIRAGDEYSMGNQLKGFFVFLAVFAVFGLLEALILKKKDPESN